MVADAQGELEICQGFIERQLSLAEASGNLEQQATAHGHLGVVIHLRADAGADEELYRAAAPHYERSLVFNRRLGRRVSEVNSMANLAQVYIRQGRDRDAQLLLREALSNTARHAGPCRVKVALVLAPDELDLVVADDGRGPDGGEADEGCGQGLRNMRERARRLGGRLVVEPAPGGGTRLILAVPLDSEEPEADSTSSPEMIPEVRTS